MNAKSTGIAKSTGGPGTQKTGWLLRQIELDCQRRGPEGIGAVSLTRAAIRTIKARMKMDDGEKKSTVGTIHSICFHLLGKPEIADTAANLKKFSAANPQFALTAGKKVSEDGDADDEVMADNDRLMGRIGILRNQQISEVSWPAELRPFWNAWKGWMLETGMRDFTGMIEECLARRLAPDIDILYCDETQDQSSLANELILLWAGCCEKVVFVGDADQAIYRFSGASPENFMEIKANHTDNRPQSYRLPPVIRDYALAMIGKCRRRIPITYLPVTPGIVESRNAWLSSLGDEPLPYNKGDIFTSQEPDLSLPGTHMILTRCNFSLKKWQDWLYEKKVSFHNPYRKEDLTWNPTETKGWKACETYLRLMEGQDIPASHVQKMAHEVIAKEVMEKGKKKEFTEKVFERAAKIDQFSLISEGFKEDFVFGAPDIERFFKLKGRAAELLVNLPESDILKKPKVILGTIHSVKGGEADYVWVDHEISWRIKKDFLNDEGNTRDDEIRVAYVAVTRARQGVCILQTKTRNKNPVLE